MTPETAAEIEVEVMARRPSFRRRRPRFLSLTTTRRRWTAPTQLETEEAEGGGEKGTESRSSSRNSTTTTTNNNNDNNNNNSSRRGPLARGVRPGRQAAAAARRLRAQDRAVLEALAEADLEVRDDPPTGTSDLRTRPTFCPTPPPRTLKPEHADGAGHTLPLDVTDRPGPGDEAIRAKVAELRETMRSCAELIARHARDENPAKTKLVSDLAHVLRAASEKEARESAATKEGDETGRGAGNERTATSETDRSLPEFTGRVPDAVRETRELIRDMEERVKAPLRDTTTTAAAVRDRRRRPAAHRGGDAEGMDRLNAERLITARTPPL